MTAGPATIADVVAALDRVAPFAKAGGWDPVGLQLGDRDAPARRVAVCHEVTEGIVGRLEGEPADLLVSYHPLLFRPTTRLVAGTSPSGRAFRLVRAGVALGVVHTAFDVAPGGAADALAGALGLTHTASFGPSWGPDAVKVVVFVPTAHADVVSSAMGAAGGGVIGNYSGCSFRSPGLGTFLPGEGSTPVAGGIGVVNLENETRIEMIAPASACDAVVAALVAAHPYEEPAFDVYEVRGNAGFIGRIGQISEPTALHVFAEHVEQTLQSECRVAGDRTRGVRTVAVVPGSGGSFVGTAGQADVIVTGDVGHHQARTAGDKRMAVVDPGHAATERPGVARLYAAVAEVVGDAVDLTGVDADPWRG